MSHFSIPLKKMGEIGLELPLLGINIDQKSLMILISSGTIGTCWLLDVLSYIENVHI